MRRPEADGQPPHDFETACRGPSEYDPAALAENAALDAYGSYDRGFRDAMWPQYTTWVTASMMIALPGRPELAGAVDERLSHLRTI